MSEIFWIASYPKSGNTWLRALLTNLLHGGSAPAAINDLAGESMAGARAPFEEATGLDSSELTIDEIDRLRPEVYRHLAQHSLHTLFLKIHDACGISLPRDISAGVWYVIRNPLDVCVSFAHHTGDAGFTRTIEAMEDDSCTLNIGPFSRPGQFPQRLLTWSRHALSWVEAPGLRVHVIRYEDLINDPEKTFLAAADFAGVSACLADVKSAVARSSFAELRAQEDQRGFRERRSGTSRFFRRGKVGSWREELSDSQARRIIDAHGEVMRRFGYLDERGTPVF